MHRTAKYQIVNQLCVLPVNNVLFFAYQIANLKYCDVFLILKYVINLDCVLVHNLKSMLIWEIFCELEVASWYRQGFCRHTCEDKHLLGRAWVLPFPLRRTAHREAKGICCLSERVTWVNNSHSASVKLTVNQ